MKALPLRIAILECDTPLDNTRRIYKGYGGVFKQMLGRAADELGHPGLNSREGFELKNYDVQLESVTYPRLEDIDAILITGSRYDAYGDVPWINKLVEFTKTVLDQNRVRVIGVCFGHQIVGRALGQKVGRGDKGWEVSVVPVELSPKGKELFGVETLSIWQMHKDIVYGFPPSVAPLAQTDVCENQGMYIERKLITVQGHPEFTREIEEEIIKSRYSQGIFTDEQYSDAMRRLQDHDDGITIAQAFWRFLLQE